MGILDYDLVPPTESMLIEIEGPKWGPFSHEPRIMWAESAGEWVLLTLPNSENEQSTSMFRHDGKTLNKALDEHFCLDGKWSRIDAKLQRGDYHPRIWRNGLSDEVVTPTTVHPSMRSIARTRCVAFHRIQRQLVEVFEIVSPVRSNAEAFGAGIQQVLALAAMEVETLFRGAHELNCSSRPASASIDSWVQLAAPMRLVQWSAQLRHFVDWGAVSPFQDWTAAAAPFWWTANNKLKHEETKSNLANLAAAVSAVAAIRILLEAQFGPGVNAFLPDAGLATIDIDQCPTWAPTELYFAPRRGAALVSVPALG